MKDNPRLYRMIRLMRLQKKNSNPSPEAHLALETLAQATTSLQGPEAVHDVVALSNPMQVEETPEEEEQS